MGRWRVSGVSDDSCHFCDSSPLPCLLLLGRWRLGWCLSLLAARLLWIILILRVDGSKCECENGGWVKGDGRWVMP